MDHLKIYQRINQVSIEANDSDELLSSILDEMLVIFNCDRAWLLEPCDPIVSTSRVFMECTRSECCGVLAEGCAMPSDFEMTELFQQAIESKTVITVDVRSDQVPFRLFTDDSSANTMMALALLPKSSKPWLLGVQHCAKPNVFSDEEKQIFSMVSQSITISLSNLIAMRVLRDSERYNRTLFEQSPIGLALCRMNGELVDVNPAYATILGRSVEETLSLTYWEITPEKFAKQEASQLKSLKKNGRYRPYEKEYIHKNGRLIPVRLSGMTFEKEGEKFIWSSVENIIERKQAEKASLEKEKKYHYLFDNMTEAFVLCEIICDEKGIPYDYRILEVNKAYEQQSGIKGSDIVGKTVLEFFPDIEKSWIEIYGEVALTKKPRTFVNYNHNTNKYFETSAFSYERGQFALIFKDITEHKKQEDHILHQAHFDCLTNIPNRLLALDRLEQLIKEAHRFGNKMAVLFLDLDDFKMINDSLGHEVGDKILVQVVKRLSKVLRDSDTIGRLGGDEFVVLMGGLTDATDVNSVAESLLECFHPVFRVDDKTLILTASIGISIFPDNGNNSAALLRNADTAMYHSKEQERSIYHYFTDSMNCGVTRRLALEEQLHNALARREFHLCYQPVVDLKDGSTIGVEALLRWRNAALGDVSPMEFIPIAEQTGLIVPIGQYLLTEALTRAAYWQQNGSCEFKIAINMSPRQFRVPSLVSFIKEALQQAGISGESLQLEITEGVLIGNHSHILSALEGLNLFGVSIAMDDFGTGYSSLNYLRNYPFDILKIDRSFVNEITKDKTNRELVNAAIAMGHGLGLKVVAEGVETEEQLAQLEAQGCDFAQGYLFSKPVSHTEITRMLEG